MSRLRHNRDEIALIMMSRWDVSTRTPGEFPQLANQCLVTAVFQPWSCIDVSLTNTRFLPFCLFVVTTHCYSHHHIEPEVQENEIEWNGQRPDRLNSALFQEITPGTLNAYWPKLGQGYASCAVIKCRLKVRLHFYLHQSLLWCLEKWQPEVNFLQGIDRVSVIYSFIQHTFCTLCGSIINLFSKRINKSVFFFFTLQQLQL